MLPYPCLFPLSETAFDGPDHFIIAQMGSLFANGGFLLLPCMAGSTVMVLPGEFLGSLLYSGGRISEIPKFFLSRLRPPAFNRLRKTWRGATF